jgi:hypothetical protein
MRARGSRAAPAVPIGVASEARETRTVLGGGSSIPWPPAATTANSRMRAVALVRMLPYEVEWIEEQF